LIVGRSQWDSPEIDNQVLIKQSSQNIIPGDLVAVKIGQVTPYDLKGEIVSLWDDAMSPTLLNL